MYNNCIVKRSLSLSTGAIKEHKLSTTAEFPVSPDGAKQQGESVAASPTSSAHCGLHIAAFLPQFCHIL